MGLLPDLNDTIKAKALTQWIHLVMSAIIVVIIMIKGGCAEDNYKTMWATRIRGYEFVARRLF